jgi:alginate O-acetyltransferase complex protein AlgI
MLFNFYEFLLVFLPLTLLGFYLAGAYVSRLAALAFLVTASLFFYGWWNPAYLVLLPGSLLFHFTLGRLLAVDRSPRSQVLLVVGGTVNLAAIGYFKYANCFVDDIFHGRLA